MKKKWLLIPIVIFIILVAIVTVLLLFKDSATVADDSLANNTTGDLSKFYSENHAGKSDSEMFLTDSAAVDSAVNEIMSENGYVESELLEQWTDTQFNAECYFVLFDNTELYCIKETSKGEVFYSKDDYEYYLEMQ